MKKIILLIVSMVLMVSGLFAESTLDRIQERGILKVGMNPEYMPFEMYTKKGEIIGYDVDMAKRMAKDMGVKLEIVPMSWDALIPGLITNKYDIIISGMTITQKRNLRVNYADPYEIMGATVVMKSKHIGTVRSAKDLDKEGMVIAAKIGDTGLYAAQRFFKKAKIVTFETLGMVMAEVIDGKADAWVFDKPHNLMMMHTDKADNIVHLTTPLSYEMMGWAVRKGDPDFLNWLNAFLRQMKNDKVERFSEGLREKWLNNTKWLKRVQ